MKPSTVVSEISIQSRNILTRKTVAKKNNYTRPKKVSFWSVQLFIWLSNLLSLSFLYLQNGETELCALVMQSNIRVNKRAQHRKDISNVSVPQYAKWSRSEGQYGRNRHPQLQLSLLCRPPLELPSCPPPPELALRSPPRWCTAAGGPGCCLHNARNK